MSLPAEELAQCAAQVASNHAWPVAELVWQSPNPVWLLPALLLQLSKLGVFARRSLDGSGSGGGGGTIQIAVPELAVATRPLLLLPPRDVSINQLEKLSYSLHGVEVLQPDSGQLLLVTRNVNSGPLVITVGSCRGGQLKLLPLPPKPPGGPNDLRVVNKTYRVARFDWSHSDRLSLFHLAEDIVALLQDILGFKTIDTMIHENPLSQFFSLLQNGSLDFGVAIFGWSQKRHPYTKLSMALAHYDRGMFIRTPEPSSVPSFSGSLESHRLQALAIGLLLVAAIGGFVIFRLTRAPDSRLVTFCLLTIGSVAAQGLALRPGSMSQHIAAAVVLGVGMMTFQFYTAGLLAQVTTEQARLPFKHLDDVIRLPEWHWAVQERSVGADVLRYYPRPGANFTNVLNDGIMEGNMTKWVSRAARGKFGFFSITSLVVDQCTVIRCPSVCLHPQKLMRGWGGLPFHRNMKEWRLFDAALLRMKETGLLSRLYQRRLPERLLRSVERCDLDARPRTRWSSLGLSECGPLFAILLGGSCAAVILLGLELLAGKLKEFAEDHRTTDKGQRSCPSEQHSHRSSVLSVRERSHLDAIDESLDSTILVIS